MATPGKLDVTCFEITVYQAYVQLISLRPISALCYVGSFDSPSMVGLRLLLLLLLLLVSFFFLKDHLSAHFKIRLIFPIRKSMIVKELECSSVKPNSEGKIEYGRAACTTAIIEGKVHCTCGNYGFFFVTRKTQTSDDLKTAIPMHFRYNIPLLIIFILC